MNLYPSKQNTLGSLLSRQSGNNNNNGNNGNIYNNTTVSNGTSGIGPQIIYVTNSNTNVIINNIIPSVVRTTPIGSLITIPASIPWSSNISVDIYTLS
jgi:hypothetical protein